VKVNPATGKQLRGFALLSPERRQEIQERGRATLRSTAAPKKWAATREQLHDLHWTQGLSLSQIADLYQVCPQSVLNRMRKLGVPRRPSSAATALRRLDPEIAKRASEARRGPKSRWWKGGLTPLYQILRTTAPMRMWRKAVFLRDDYTCQSCGKRGGNLHADHKIPFARIIAEEGICSVDSALSCARLWDTANGRTLCEGCHRATDTFGKKLSA